MTKVEYYCSISLYSICSISPFFFFFKVDEFLWRLNEGHLFVEASEEIALNFLKNVTTLSANLHLLDSGSLLLAQTWRSSRS